MHKDPDIYSGNNDIICSDYRFVYMGAKGLSECEALVLFLISLECVSKLHHFQLRFDCA